MLLLCCAVLLIGRPSAKGVARRCNLVGCWTACFEQRTVLPNCQCIQPVQHALCCETCLGGGDKFSVVACHVHVDGKPLMLAKYANSDYNKQLDAFLALAENEQDKRR